MADSEALLYQRMQRIDYRSAKNLVLTSDGLIGVAVAVGVFVLSLSLSSHL